jgi:hypothetical protein
MAIGKKGQNIRLATDLTGYELDMYNYEELPAFKAKLAELQGKEIEVIEIVHDEEEEGAPKAGAKPGALKKKEKKETKDEKEEKDSEGAKEAEESEKSNDDSAAATAESQPAPEAQKEEDLVSKEPEPEKPKEEDKKKDEKATS